MEKRYCGKCGSEIDKNTGLCPNCDATALEKVYEANTKKSLKKSKRRGVTAIIALILVFAIVVSSVVFGVSKGWIGNNSEEEKKKVQTTYITYLNKTIIPEIGEYDSDHPESSNEGIHSALFCDLNNDDKEEFVVAYSKENGGNIDLNISCYEYDEETKGPEKAEENVELIGTVTPSTEPDYTDNNEDEYHFSNQTIVYSVVYNDKKYIVCEHLSWLDEYNYECHIYTVENGKFIEVSNIFRERFGTSGAEYVYSKYLPDEMKINNDNFEFSLAGYMNEMKHSFYDYNYSILFYQDSGEDGYEYIYDTYFDTANAAVCEFFKCFGITKNNYIEDSPIRITNPNESDLIFSYLYYWEYDEDGNIVEKYEINDFTDWKSLIEKDDTFKTDDSNEIDIAETINDAAQFAHSWFYDNTHTDKSKSITKHITADWGDSDFVFEPITEKSIKSKNDLIELTNKYFTDSVTDELMNMKQWYEEENQLYVSQTDGLGDWLIDTYDVVVNKESETKYILNIIGYMDNEVFDYPYDVNLELINGNWVLDELFAFNTEVKINVIDELSSNYNKYQQYFCYLDKLLNDDYSNSYSYGLYDIDKNGVLELIIDKHDNEADAKFVFYSYNKGIVDLGNIPAGYSALLIPNDKEKGLYRACSRMDYNDLIYLNIEKNILKNETINSEQEQYFSKCESVVWYRLGYEESDTLDPNIYENLRVILA